TRAAARVPGGGGQVCGGNRLFPRGESRAGAYSEMFSQLRQHEGVSIYLYTLGDLRIASLLRPQRECDRAAERSVLEDLKRYAKKDDIVLLASLRVLRVGTQWQNLDLTEVIATRDSEQAEIGRKTAGEEG